MYSVRALPEFTAWADGLKDEKVQTAISARIRRMELGLMGDVAPVGKGVSELRIHLGAGWRLYFTQRGDRIIVLLAGGSKSSQKKDIQRAQQLARNLKGAQQ
jgi:putative addiction module killer protein